MKNVNALKSMDEATKRAIEEQGMEDILAEISAALVNMEHALDTAHENLHEARGYLRKLAF